MVADRERRRGTIRVGDNPINKRVLEPIDPTMVGASSATLSPSVRRRIAAGVAPVLPALGYPAEPAARVVAGRAVNAMFWPGIAAQVLGRRALRRWGSPAQRREALRRNRNEQVQRRQAKEAARRSTDGDRAAR
jgi:hypothetical protein